MKNKVKAKLDNGGVLMNDFSRMFIDKYYNKEYPLFKFIIDKSNQQIAFADMKGNIVYVNDSWARNHGYMVKELVGKNLSIFHTKEELKKVHKFNKILVKKGKYVGEIEHKRRDGSTFVTLMDNFIFEPKKGLKFMVGMATDISEYKKNQLEVKKSANYLDLMAESLVVLNQDRKIVKLFYLISQQKILQVFLLVILLVKNIIIILNLFLKILVILGMLLFIIV